MKPPKTPIKKILQRELLVLSLVLLKADNSLITGCHKLTSAFTCAFSCFRAPAVSAGNTSDFFAVSAVIVVSADKTISCYISSSCRCFFRFCISSCWCCCGRGSRSITFEIKFNLCWWQTHLIVTSTIFQVTFYTIGLSCYLVTLNETNAILEIT